MEKIYMKTKKVKRNKKRGGVIQRLQRLQLPPLPLLPGEEIKLPERIKKPTPEDVIKNLEYSLENYNKSVEWGREGVSPSFLEQSPVLEINEKFKHLYNKSKGGKRNKTLKKSRSIRYKKRSIRYKK